MDGRQLIKQRSKKKVISALLKLLIAGALFSPVVANEIFPTPKIIEDNVDFWKRIYSEVSSKEGLLHDRNYPGVVFEKIKIGHLSYSQRKAFIKKKKEVVAKSLERIATMPFDSLSKKEVNILDMYSRLEAGALDSARFRLRFQRGQKERFKGGVERSGIYLDTIRHIMGSLGLPAELAYLPHVESSFDYAIESKAGALGMWQFMPATGQVYMRVDKYVDERRDPLRSTEAAAKLLSENFERFQSWPLAITAYNYGPNGIARAVASLGTNDISVILEKHDSRSFQFASRNFYSCFLAALDIAENPGNYFADLMVPTKVEKTVVSLPFPIRASGLQYFFAVSQIEVQALNPALSTAFFEENAVLPQDYLIRLPSEISQVTIDSALAILPEFLDLDTNYDILSKAPQALD